VNRALAGTLRNFFHEAGIHEPVIWHLDADAPEVSRDLPSWAMLYLRPEPQANAFLNARERTADAALRERADCLIDASVLAKPSSEGWKDVCGQIMRAACRRHRARLFQPFSI